MKRLLTETISAERKPVLAEASTEGKFVYLKGLFIEGEVPNHNGRIYPRSEIEKAVNQLNERISKFGPVAGECDHPEGLNINTDRITHAITEIRLEGNNGIGTMRVINAGMGLIVRGCVEAGINLGVSSRGSGHVDHSGRVSDFDIVTIDIVTNPSAPHAYPKASLGESLERTESGREYLSLAHAAKHDPAVQRHLKKAAHRFFTDIRDSVTWRK